MSKLSRREFLKVSGTIGLGATVFGNFLLHSAPARAGEDLYKAESFDATFKRLFKGKTPSMAKVTLEAPTIAETGATVPISIDVESPMSQSDYVEAIYVLVEDNPVPLVGIFHFSPANGKAFLATRIKMAKTSKIHAVAKTNKGDLFSATKDVKVTLGGCGG